MRVDLSGDDEHRHVVLVRGQDPGEGIDRPAAGGHHAHAEVAVEMRVALRRIGRAQLPVHGDEFQLLVTGDPIRQEEISPSGDSEDVGDSGPPDEISDEIADAHFSYSSLMSASRSANGKLAGLASHILEPFSR